MSSTIVRLQRTQTVDVTEALLDAVTIGGQTFEVGRGISSGPWKVVRKDREAPSATPRKRRRRTTEAATGAGSSGGTVVTFSAGDDLARRPDVLVRTSGGTQIGD